MWRGDLGKILSTTIVDSLDIAPNSTVERAVSAPNSTFERAVSAPNSTLWHGGRARLSALGGDCAGTRPLRHGSGVGAVCLAPRLQVAEKLNEMAGKTHATPHELWELYLYLLVFWKISGTNETLGTCETSGIE